MTVGDEAQSGWVAPSGLSAGGRSAGGPVGAPPLYVPPPIPPARPPRRGLPGWAWLLIALGGAGLLALVLWLIVVIAGAVVSISEAVGDGLQPAVSGTAGVHPAADPVVCPDECLSFTAAGAVGPSKADLETFGLTVREALDGDGLGFSSEDAFVEALETWTNESVECVFANTYVPVFVSYDAPLAERAQLEILGAWSDRLGGSTLVIGSGFFGDSASAEAHIARTAEAIVGCTGYQVADERQNLIDVTVIPAPELSGLDPSVSSVGWVEQSVNAQFYAYELQRAEVVVRVSVWTNGPLTQEESEDLVTVVSKRLEAQAVLRNPLLAE